jgi:protein O-mannosyl-transferase
VSTPTQLQKFPSVLAGRNTLIYCLLLVAGCVAIYFPATQNGFVNYDDDMYVTQNTHIQSGLTLKSLQWAATAYYDTNWHPLTWISHAIDISLFHMNPAGHHAVNILFHTLNSLLLFLILQRTTRRDWESFLVAALFALHPVNVESVAWVAERKNVLSMFFLFLTLYLYGRYAERPSVLRFLPALFCYALGLTAKPQIITLPFLLLLWDFWPLERWSPAISSDASTPRVSFVTLCLEKIPFFFLSLASAVVTIEAQTRGGAVQTTNGSFQSAAAYTLQVRIENAIVSYANYVKLLFWPVNLAPMYPHRGNAIPLIEVTFSALFLIATTVLIFVWWRKKYLPVGWLWFLGSLVPVIGIVQVGVQAMADRYAYLPFVGLFFIVVWGISDLTRNSFELRRATAAISAAVLVVLGLITFRQIHFWMNSETLWAHTLNVTEHNFVAHDSYAAYLFSTGRFAEGCSQYQASIDIFPGDIPAQLGLAICAQARGDSTQAIARYQNLLRFAGEPGIRSQAFANLGSIYRSLGQYQLAEQHYRSALALNPDLPIALVGTGLLAQKGWDYSRAAAQYQHAMQVQPTSVGYLLLAKALAQGGHPVEAQQAFEHAKQLSNNLQDDLKAAEALLAE